jgi:hypothetical protein
MKPDIYTKAVLTVIATALVALVVNQYVKPSATAQAQAKFAGVQFAAERSGGFELFDSRTGDIWIYHSTHERKGQVEMEHARIAMPGAPTDISKYDPK